MSAVDHTAAVSREQIDAELTALLTPADVTKAAPARPWKPSDLGGADWAARKLLEERRKWETERAAADAQIEQLEQWKADRYHKRQQQWGHFESLLIGYHAGQVTGEVRDNLGNGMAEDKAHDKVTKTIDLPCGVTLKRRAGSEKVEVADEAAFLANADDTLTRTTTKPDKTAIKRHIKTTGEIPEGIRFVTGGAFTVSVPDSSA